MYTGSFRSFTSVIDRSRGAGSTFAKLEILFSGQAIGECKRLTQHDCPGLAGPSICPLRAHGARDELCQ